MKPGKHQRGKRRGQDLCWKVHDCAQSFVQLSSLCMNYVTSTFLLVSSSVNNYSALCTVKAKKKRTKRYNKEPLPGFRTIPLY